MAETELKYQTLKVANRMPRRVGPSARGRGMGSAVELLHGGLLSLNSLGVRIRVQRELAKMRPQIEERMPPNGGVLVCIGIQEWEMPDSAGTRARMFLSAHIAGTGTNAQAVARRYIDTPRLLAGPARGWRRVEEFIWITRHN